MLCVSKTSGNKTNIYTVCIYIVSENFSDINKIKVMLKCETLTLKSQTQPLNTLNKVLISTRRFLFVLYSVENVAMNSSRQYKKEQCLISNK